MCDRVHDIADPFATDKPRPIATEADGDLRSAARLTGAGLSLAIVRTIITEHRGAITLDSEPHHGTRCTLRFPLIEVAQDSRSVELNGQPQRLMQEKAT